jgi:hypothetical protein
MSTAHIFVLTVALGAGVAAAPLASWSRNKPSATEPVAQLQSVDLPERSETWAYACSTGTNSLAPGSNSSKGRTV